MREGGIWNVVEFKIRFHQRRQSGNQCIRCLTRALQNSKTSPFVPYVIYVVKVMILFVSVLDFGFV